MEKRDTDNSKNTTHHENKGVSFGEVRVREHERILNPRASSRYAGLELGWAHQANSDHILVDEYEKIKETEHHEKKQHRDFERLQKLLKYGYSTKDVLALEQEKKRKLELREKGIEAPDEDKDYSFLDANKPKHGLKKFFGFK